MVRSYNASIILAILADGMSFVILENWLFDLAVFVYHLTFLLEVFPCHPHLIVMVKSFSRFSQAHSFDLRDFSVVAHGYS